MEIKKFTESNFEFDEAGCENRMYETKTECEPASSDWWDASCTSTIWTLSTSQ